VCARVDTREAPNVWTPRPCTLPRHLIATTRYLRHFHTKHQQQDHDQHSNTNPTSVTAVTRHTAYAANPCHRQKHQHRHQQQGPLPTATIVAAAGARRSAPQGPWWFEQEGPGAWRRSPRRGAETAHGGAVVPGLGKSCGDALYLLGTTATTAATTTTTIPTNISSNTPMPTPTRFRRR
jgi:hypothetical protein